MTEYIPPMPTRAEIEAHEKRFLHFCIEEMWRMEQMQRDIGNQPINRDMLNLLMGRTTPLAYEWGSLLQPTEFVWRVTKRLTVPAAEPATSANAAQTKSPSDVTRE